MTFCLQEFVVHQRLLRQDLVNLGIDISSNIKDDVYCCVVAARTWMPTMMMRLMLMTTGTTITLLPPLAGMIQATTRSRLPTCAQTATPRTIIRAPMSTAGIASCRPPCSCEQMPRRRVCAFVCKYVCMTE